MWISVRTWPSIRSICSSSGWQSRWSSASPYRSAPCEAAPCITARIAFEEGPPTGTLHRVGWLTPYTAQTIGEDALRAGPGARLQVTVAPIADAASLARVRDAFAWLGARGVQVTVTADDHQRRRPARAARRTPERPTAGHPGAAR